MRRIIFSKQCDNDLDLIPLWYYWYTTVFKADTIIITPVKTALSGIEGTQAFYRQRGVMTVPIELPRWEEERIWQHQLAAVRTLLHPGEPFVAMSADTDQFFEPPSADDLAGSELVYHRCNIVAEGTPTEGNVATIGMRAFRSYFLVAGYINSLENPAVWCTGHFDSAFKELPSAGLLREFHVCLRGFVAFSRKIGNLSIINDGSDLTGGWKKLRTAFEEGGLPRLQQEYEKWVQWVAEDPEDSSVVEIFRRYVQGAGTFRAAERSFFPYSASVVEPEIRGADNKVQAKIAIPRNEIQLINETFQSRKFALPRLSIFSQPFTALDIGSHVGLFGLQTKLTYPHASLHCVDAFKPNVDLAAKNFKGKGNVRLTHAAASAAPTNGVVKLFLDRQASWKHSLLRRPNQADVALSSPSRSITQLFDDTSAPPVRVLRLATNGTEAELLGALGERLSTVACVIVDYHGEAARRAIDGILSEFSLFGAHVTRLGEGTLKFVRTELVMQSA